MLAACCESVSVNASYIGMVPVPTGGGDREDRVASNYINSRRDELG